MIVRNGENKLFSAILQGLNHVLVECKMTHGCLDNRLRRMIVYLMSIPLIRPGDNLLSNPNFTLKYALRFQVNNYFMEYIIFRFNPIL